MGIRAVKRAARAVFFDRDGVLNDAVVQDGLPHPPASLAELRIPPVVPALVARLRAAGFLAIGVTNQPDVARGRQTREVADALNRAVRAGAALDAMLVCYHDDADRCRCRKPAPGLLEAAASRYGIDLSESIMVGDRWRDVEAGRRARCRTVFIDYDYREAKPMPPPDVTVRSLEEGVAWVLGESQATPSAGGRSGCQAPTPCESSSSPTVRTRPGCSRCIGNPLIKGFTTNPTLMRKAGITDYPAFARDDRERRFRIARFRSRCFRTSSTKWNARRP